jgi:endonuclease YncB( thermonuclease family)
MELNQPLAREKADNRCRRFPTQSDKHWVDGDTFLVLMPGAGWKVAQNVARRFMSGK